MIPTGKMSDRHGKKHGKRERKEKPVKAVKFQGTAAPTGQSKDASTPVQLSKNLLGLKFMRRRKDSMLRDQVEAAEPSINVQESHWVVSNSTNEAVVVADPSYMSFENLGSYGRRSFNKFNPEVEKTMAKLKEKPKKVIDLTEATADVSANEMADRYKSFLNPGKARADQAAAKPQQQRQVGSSKQNEQQHQKHQLQHQKGKPKRKNSDKGTKKQHKRQRGVES